MVRYRQLSDFREEGKSFVGMYGLWMVLYGTYTIYLSVGTMRTRKITYNNTR